MIKPYVRRIAVVDPPMEEQKGLPGGFEVIGNVDKINRGIVIAVGESVPEIQAGYVVWYNHNCGIEINRGDQKVKVIPDECVIAYDEEDV